MKLKSNSDHPSQAKIQPYIAPSRKGTYDILKRAVDIICALSGLVICAPMFVLIAIWIKLDSTGPILYRGRRVGRYGKPFFQLKFRTMIQDAELIGGSRTPNTDTRITRSGKLLRKYKLDEFPQLFNILTNDMSIVGPRPDVEEYVQLYSDAEMSILHLKPGLTDWATLWYRDEGDVLESCSDPEFTYQQAIHPVKVKLQMCYLHGRSFLLDLHIITLTAIGLLRKKWLPAALAKRLRYIGEPVALARDVARSGSQNIQHSA